jgi:hypothetical protein
MRIYPVEDSSRAVVALLAIGVRGFYRRAVD